MLMFEKSKTARFLYLIHLGKCGNCLKPLVFLTHSGSCDYFTFPHI